MNDITKKIASLSPAKRALLEMRLKQQKVNYSHQQGIPRNSYHNPLPLSFAQQRMWFSAQFDPNSPLYNVANALEIKGFLNVDFLQQALDAIVDRHGMLRSTIKQLDGEPVQIIAPNQRVPIQLVDLREVEIIERKNEFRQLIEQEIQRPFDLEIGSLLRVTLLRLDEAEYVLLLTNHHIVSDDWSIAVFWRELIALYEASKTASPSPLSELPIQYADFAVFERQWLTGEVLESQLNYWKQQLKDLPVLELPTDRPRPPVQTYRGAWLPVSLPQDLSDALKKLSITEGVTLFMTLLAAFQTLLYRYTGLEDIVVGTPIAGRNSVETEGLIGFFVNTLVLRSDLSGNPSFQQLLGRVRSVAMSAYAHQNLPFEKLVEELQPERDLSRTPLFSVMFVFQNTSMALELPGMTLTPVEIHNGTAKFDLTFDLKETSEGIRGGLEYNTDLFDAATIIRMQGHFQTLLEGIIANPMQRLSELPLLTDLERHQLLFEWNDTDSDYPDRCIHQLFEAQVERTPDAVAVMFEDSGLTYQQLNTLANQLAHHLQKLSVGPEVLVGIYVERSLLTVVGLLGILKAGGAYVPLDPAYPQERLAYMLSDSQVSVLLTTEKLATALPETKARVVCLDKDLLVIKSKSDRNLISSVLPHNLAYICYTSGSTGKPKGVQVLHRGVIRLLFGVNYAQLDAAQKFLAITSISFDVFTLEVWGALLHGGCCVLFPGNIPTTQDLSHAIQKYGITSLWLTTALFNSVIDDNPKAFSGIQQLMIGGEALSVTHIHRALESLPSTQIVNGYGPSESTTLACCYPIPRQLDNTIQSIPIGQPIGNTQVYVLDAQLQPTPIGVPGELYIGGAGLARGYLNRPELTQEKFIPNPFSQEQGARLYKSGDKVRYLKDGNIEYLGRSDNQVKIRSFRIELGEIEAVLSQYPDVLQTVVISRVDVPGDKRLVAYLVVKQQPSPTISNLRDYLKQKLPEYMVPNAFVFLDAMPLTPNGKIDRRALPAPDTSYFSRDKSFVAPRTPTEEVLAAMWAQVLGTELVGIHDNFFELGGHSLLAVKLFAQIEQKFAKKLPLATLFQSGTVGDIAKMLSQQEEKAIDRQVLTQAHREEKSVADWSPLVAIQPKGDKPPLFCIHPVGGEILCYRDLAVHLGTDRPLYGLRSQGLDGKQPLLTRIEDMAALYIREIQRIQPTGPYFLGGFSMGGVIAYEMAQQLYSQGQQVGILAMFDSRVPGSTKRSPFKKRIFIHINNFFQFGPDYLSKKLVSWWLWGKSHLLEKYRHLLGIKDNLPEGETYNNITDANMLALKAYTFCTYPGRITLFRTDDNSRDAQEAFVGFQTDRLLGWGKLITGGIDLHNILGSHFTMLDEPHVRVVAEKLKDCLEKVQRTL